MKKDRHFKGDNSPYLSFALLLFIGWIFSFFDFFNPMNNHDRIYDAKIHYPVVNASDYNEALEKYFFGFNPDLITLKSPNIKKELSESNDEYLNLYKDARSINIQIRHCFDSFNNTKELNTCINSYYPKEEEFSRKVQKWVNNRVDIAKRWNDTEAVIVNNNDLRGIPYSVILSKNQKNNDYFQSEYLGKEDLTPTFGNTIKKIFIKHIN